MSPFPASAAMARALDEGRAAGARGEVPVGAIVCAPDGRVVAAAGNRTLELRDPTAHAEMLAIRAACAASGSERLPGYSIHVTLEPCPMCASAIAQARISLLVYGASDLKSGGVEQGPRIFTHAQCHHIPEIISGIGEIESAELLKDFFQRLRNRT